MKFLDFFSGIGTIRIGMEQAGHECVGHVEWDKYAQASYMAMHDVKESEFIGWDIRGVRADELPRANAWWFGAPCQDFSIAGKRAGLEGDRSSLVREIFRLVRETPEGNRPEWLLYENVKGMLSSNGGFDFLGILLEMDELGYDIEWQTLNSKNFGVPQNRERVFTIGHSRRYGRREILPITGSDKKNSENIIKEIAKMNSNRHSSLMNSILSDEGICPTLDTMQGGNRQPKIIQLGNVNPSGNGMNGNVFDSTGLSPTLTTNKGEGMKIVVREATSKGYAIAEPGDSINLEQPNSKTRRGRVGKGIANTLTTSCNQAVIEPKDEFGRMGKQAAETFNENNPLFGDTLNPYNKKIDRSGCSPTLTTRPEGFKTAIIPITKDLRIRKLTPRECFRLQGIPDEYFDKAQAVNSDSQLYKQAGNACSVPVIKAIAERLEKGGNDEEQI